MTFLICCNDYLSLIFIQAAAQQAQANAAEAAAKAAAAGLAGGQHKDTSHEGTSYEEYKAAPSEQTSQEYYSPDFHN